VFSVLMTGSNPAAPTITKLLVFQRVGNSDGKMRAKLYIRAQSFAPIRRREQNFAEAVEMLSVYTRHHPDCKNAGDKTWRRCSCPKWIWGSLNGKFIRQSARTHLWEQAEELRLRLSQGEPAPTPPIKPTEAGTSLGLAPIVLQTQPMPVRQAGFHRTHWKRVVLLGDRADAPSLREWTWGAWRHRMIRPPGFLALSIKAFRRKQNLATHRAHSDPAPIVTCISFGLWDFKGYLAAQ
jgi:hypothetical protein